jgi:hypothetical protein
LAVAARGLCAILTFSTFSSLLLGQSASRAPNVSLFDNSADVEPAARGSVADMTTNRNSAREATCDSNHKGEFAVAPIPIVNPTIGDGLALAVLYMASFDECKSLSEPSTFGLLGMKTNNGSWMAGAGVNLLLHGDRYRITVGAGEGSLHYPFFGIGNSAGSEGVSIGIAQRSTAYLIEPKVRIFRKWYVGPRYHNIKSRITVDNPSDSDGSRALPKPPEEDLDQRTAALGLRLQNDTRDTTFYPRKGSFLDTTLDFYDAAFGGRRSYDSILFSFSKFHGYGSKSVLAVRGSLCSTWGSVPFYDLCELGFSQDLRGYPIGQYRDRRFAASQVEFRRELFWRVGAVAFIGAGEVGKTFGEFRPSNILPGGGLGLRFLLTRRSHVNLRADYAIGRDSHALYVGVTEAF